MLPSRGAFQNCHRLKMKRNYNKRLLIEPPKLVFFCCCLFAFGGFNLFECFSFWGEEFYLIYLFIKGHHSEQIWRVQWHEFLNVWSRRQKQEWDVEKVKCATQLTLMAHSSDTFTLRISTSGYLFFTQKVCCFFPLCTVGDKIIIIPLQCTCFYFEYRV